MKKIFFLFSFLGMFAFAANAQEKASCSKTASGGKSCCASKSAAAAAEKAAATDESIVRQVSNDGQVSYTRKAVCPVTSKVSYENVEFCTKTNKFVNVSPSEVNAAECSKDAKATKTATTAKKACCANKAACAKPGEKASTDGADAEPKVKLVNDKENNQ